MPAPETDRCHLRGIYLIIVPVLGFGICAFLSITGVQTRWLSRASSKTAESVYGNYADSDHKQHQYAEHHGGTWTNAEGAEPRRPEHAEL